jgi:hypothetical protein
MDGQVSAKVKVTSRQLSQVNKGDLVTLEIK